MAIRLYYQHGLPVVAPDSGPFQHEPRGKSSAALGGDLLLQGLRRNPAPVDDFVGISPDRLAASSYIHRAQLILRAGRVELRLVLKFEQELRRAANTQLFVQAALRGRLQRLVAARMAAAAVRPIHRP